MSSIEPNVRTLGVAVRSPSASRTFLIASPVLRVSSTIEQPPARPPKGVGSPGSISSSWLLVLIGVDGGVRLAWLVMSPGVAGRLSRRRLSRPLAGLVAGSFASPPELAGSVLMALQANSTVECALAMTAVVKPAQIRLVEGEGAHEDLAFGRGKPHRTNELLAIRKSHRHTQVPSPYASPSASLLAIHEERFSIDDEHFSIDEERFSIDEERFSIDEERFSIAEEHLSRILDFPVSSTRISSSAICRRCAQCAFRATGSPRATQRQLIRCSISSSACPACVLLLIGLSGTSSSSTDGRIASGQKPYKIISRPLANTPSIAISCRMGIVPRLK
ncbi:hypothetical protein K525DRAFT_267538 [Schizophyllum commune Loenen D]|nr:hypothetical protein K525DRAFT_267538 [Schizophyllum commune Loenen D]